jgi:hypothetical protein
MNKGSTNLSKLWLLEIGWGFNPPGTSFVNNAAMFALERPAITFSSHDKSYDAVRYGRLGGVASGLGCGGMFAW